MGWQSTCYSYVDMNSIPQKVRPVVTLKSDVNLQWNSTTNQWDIQ